MKKTSTTDGLVNEINPSKKTSTKNAKTSKPFHQKVEDWAKGTLAPFICKVVILTAASYGTYVFLTSIDKLPPAAVGSLATVLMAGLIAGASMKKSRK